MEKVNRWFVRCYDCCAVAAVDKDPLVPAYWQGAVIGLRFRNDAAPMCECGGKMYSMGRVTGNRMIREDLRCACDSRCTHATGPNCDCVCQGANHGTGKMVCVRIDEGGIPRVEGGSKERAEELRAALSAARERIKKLPFYDDIEAGRWVSDRAAWERVRDERRRLSNVKSLKTHKARVSAASKVAV